MTFFKSKEFFALLALLLAISLQAQNGYLVQLHDKQLIDELLKPIFPALNLYYIEEGDAPMFRARSGAKTFYPNPTLELRGGEGLVPNDPQWDRQWNLLKIQAPEAWEITTGGLSPNGDTIVVAVLDLGTEVSQEDLMGNFFINRQEIPSNGVDDDNNGWIDDVTGIITTPNTFVHPRTSHGVACAAAIGARGDNGKGIAGVMWGGKILPISLQRIDLASVLAGYSYCYEMRRRYNLTNGNEGAFIVATNNSFGLFGQSPSSNPLWCEAYDLMGQEGILSVSSVPNMDVEIRDGVWDMPTSCPSEWLITVTKTDRFDSRQQAAYGDQYVDLAAPSGYYSAVIGLATYSDFGGTSAASPMVAGAVALLSSYPSDSLGELMRNDRQAAMRLIKQAILEGVDKPFNLNNLLVSDGRLNLVGSFASLQTHLAIENDFKAIKSYPNPIGNAPFLSLELSISAPSEIFVDVFDAKGALLSKYNLQHTKAGRQIHLLPSIVFQKGINFVRLTNKDGCQVFRVVK